MLGKLKEIFGKGPAVREGGAPELRLDPRFNLVSFPIAMLRFDERTALQVIDISYGGIGAVNTGDFNLPKRAAAKLSVMNRAVEIEVILVHDTNGIIGFQFVHDSQEILNFLREILESIRIGFTMEPIKQWQNDSREDVLHLESSKEHANCEIVTRSDDGAVELVQLSVYFKFEKAKCNLIYRDQKYTLEVGSPDPYKNCFNETARKKKEKKIIRCALLTVMGFKSTEHSFFIRAAIERVMTFV